MTTRTILKPLGPLFRRQLGPRLTYRGWV